MLQPVGIPDICITYKAKKAGGPWYPVIELKGDLRKELGKPGLTGHFESAPQHLTTVNRFNERLKTLRAYFGDVDLKKINIQSVDGAGKPNPPSLEFQQSVHNMLREALQTAEDVEKLRGICMENLPGVTAKRKRRFSELMELSPLAGSPAPAGGSPAVQSPPAAQSPSPASRTPQRIAQPSAAAAALSTRTTSARVWGGTTNAAGNGLDGQAGSDTAGAQHSHELAKDPVPEPVQGTGPAAAAAGSPRTVYTVHTTMNACPRWQQQVSAGGTPLSAGDVNPRQRQQRQAGGRTPQLRRQATTTEGTYLQQQQQQQQQAATGGGTQGQVDIGAVAPRYVVPQPYGNTASGMPLAVRDLPDAQVQQQDELVEPLALRMQELLRADLAAVNAELARAESDLGAVQEEEARQEEVAARVQDKLACLQDKRAKQQEKVGRLRKKKESLDIQANHMEAIAAERRR